MSTPTTMKTRAERLRELGFTHWDTGGGCTGLGFERADGAQLLITDDGRDPYDMPDQAPRGDDTTVTLGCYSPEGEQLWFDEYSPAQTDDLIRRIDSWICEV